MTYQDRADIASSNGRTEIYYEQPSRPPRKKKTLEKTSSDTTRCRQLHTKKQKGSLKARPRIKLITTANLKNGSAEHLKVDNNINKFICTVMVSKANHDQSSQIYDNLIMITFLLPYFHFSMFVIHTARQLNRSALKQATSKALQSHFSHMCRYIQMLQDKVRSEWRLSTSMALSYLVVNLHAAASAHSYLLVTLHFPFIHVQ